MGTTLTGTTPQDTYDSLIKVTDNGPLSGSLKVLTDGLGNNSTLSLSTAAASIAGTLAVTGATTLSAATSISGASTSGFVTPLTIKNPSSNAASAVKIAFDAGATIWGEIGASYNVNDPYMAFFVRAGSEKVRITDAGNVGIGTSAPTAGYKLDVAGRTKAYNAGYIADFVSTESNASSIQLYADNTNVSIVQGGTAAVPLTFFVSGTEKMRIQTGGGISFNGDTAAANALDDYEEGTFTATLRGSATDPTTAVTTTANYTKIGRQVTISIMFANVNTTGAAGAVRVTGLPFSCAVDATGAVTTELFTFGLTRTSVNSWVGTSAATTVNFFVSGNDTSFDNLSHNAGTGRYLYTSLTYFV